MRMGEQEGEQDPADKYDVIGPEEGTAICTDPEHPVVNAGAGEARWAEPSGMHCMVWLDDRMSATQWECVRAHLESIGFAGRDGYKVRSMSAGVGGVRC